MPSETSVRTTGTVKFFDDKKGWGFITADTMSEDIFVHYSQINSKGRKTLKEGNRVEFEVNNSQRGYMAIEVKKL